MITHRNCLILVLLISLFVLSSIASAAPEEYLKYQDPQTASSSPLSTFSYVFSLIITFTIVIGLAYVTSKFLGRRLGQASLAGDNRVLTTFSLGPNKAIYIVEVAGKFMILGITEHSITLLQEVTEQEEIRKLKELASVKQPLSPFDQVFENHLASLQNMSHKFPSVFKHNETNEKEGKR